MAAPLRFGDFVDFVLARLYELDNGEFVDVNEVAAELLKPVPDMWPYDAAKLLADRGLVHEAIAMGKPDAMINGAGRLFVEEQERLSGSTINEYRSQPSHFVIVAGTGNQVVVGSEGTSQSTTSKEPG